MSDERKTDWQAVARASLSTWNDPSKNDINEALAGILERFARPIGKYFERRLRAHRDIAVEEILAEFYAYVIAERKKIFRAADPSGKLQSYLYSIAWSFANKYIAKIRRAPSFRDDMELASSSCFSPDIEAENKEETEYVKLVVNLALDKLKARDRAKYNLLKYKYFSGSPKPSAREIGVFLGILKSSDSKRRVKKAENTVNQRLSRAREAFSALIDEEISLTLEALSESSEIEQPAKEKKILCRKYLQGAFEDAPTDDIDRLVLKILGSDLPEREETWRKILPLLQERLCAYFSRCLTQNGVSRARPQELFADFRAYFLHDKCARTFSDGMQVNYYPYCMACEFITSRVDNGGNYTVLLTTLALDRLREKDACKYDLLVKTFLSGCRPTACDLAVSFALLTRKEAQGGIKLQKAQNLIYQRLKRAKHAFYEMVDELLEITLPLLYEKICDRDAERLKQRAKCRECLEHGLLQL